MSKNNLVSLSSKIKVRVYKIELNEVNSGTEGRWLLDGSSFIFRPTWKTMDSTKEVQF